MMMRQTRTNYFNLNLLPSAALERVEIDGKRLYRTPSGNLYPSVTTVLSGMNYQSIQAWKNSIGEEQANRIMTSAARRGTGMHELCERYMLNHDDYRYRAMPTSIFMFNQIKSYLDRHVDNVYGVEMRLYSDELKAAGTCDMFCRMHNINTVVDFKTSSRLKEESKIENYFYQATAYAMMIEELHKKTVIPQIAILIATPEGEPQFFLKHTSPYRSKVSDYFKLYHSS